ncbi:hypothetical protein F7725_003407 [Dissostichus mawsoni]|uniref:Uncharacterized protein n=1 Tax=Dissostichus mawsoni TaxID=36200 RepID=A0A7J5YC44_DISMA|nr:hypothetical protein F7725_003407 [Dissostichus mawsoni]
MACGNSALTQACQHSQQPSESAAIAMLLDAFVQYGNGTLPRVLGSEAGGHFGSAACCVFVNHLGLGGNGCLWLHGPATSWQAPRTAETMGIDGFQRCIPCATGTKIHALPAVAFWSGDSQFLYQHANSLVLMPNLWLWFIVNGYVGYAHSFHVSKPDYKNWVNCQEEVIKFTLGPLRQPQTSKACWSFVSWKILLQVSPCQIRLCVQWSLFCPTVSYGTHLVHSRTGYTKCSHECQNRGEDKQYRS